MTELTTSRHRSCQRALITCRGEHSSARLTNRSTAPRGSSPKHRWPCRHSGAKRPSPRRPSVQEREGRGRMSETSQEQPRAVRGLDGSAVLIGVRSGMLTERSMGGRGASSRVAFATGGPRHRDRALGSTNCCAAVRRCRLTVPEVRLGAACMAARQPTASRLPEGRCRGSVDQPKRSGPFDRIGAVVHPELLVGALGSFLCR